MIDVTALLAVSVCPICEKPFEGNERVHVECLREKHGGTLPEGFEELIKTFELDKK